MSAFIVSDNHIHAIVNYAGKICGEVYTTHRWQLNGNTWWDNEPDPDVVQRQKLGQLLIDANYRSVNADCMALVLNAFGLDPEYVASVVFADSVAVDGLGKSCL